MRTQPARGLGATRGLLAVASLAGVALLSRVGAAAAQGGGESSGGDAGPSPGLLLGGAAVLLLAAALVGYGVPVLRRRRAQRAVAEPGRPGLTPIPGTALAQPPAVGGRPPNGGPRSGAHRPQSDHFTQTGLASPGSGPGRAEPSRAGFGAERAAPQGQAGAPRDRSDQPRDRSDQPPRPEWGAGKPGFAAGRPPSVPQPGRERALGYTTFPDRRRAVSPESRYQARRISAACEARGMVLHKLVGDVHSYSGPDLERPGLNHALELLGSGEASCLVVAGLDRLSRSAANLGTVIEWLDEVGARLVVIDIDLDTSTEEGRVAARALARVGALERGSGEQGGRRDRVGRPESSGRRAAVSDRPLLQRRIATMRASGMTLQAIADTLNREGVPTLRGGAKWRPSSVQAATGYKRPSRESREPSDRDDD